jgi:glc operon protein GlcG
MARRTTAPNVSSPSHEGSENPAEPQSGSPPDASADDWNADFMMAPTVRLAAAQRAVAAALVEAERLAVDVCVAASDSAGHLLAFARMDRAPLLCGQIAQDKAFSVASFGGLPTGEWWRLLESEPALLHGIVKTDRLIVFGGGVPLVSEGRTVGGIGVSGGSSEQDVRIAEAGAAVLS